jgi:hypothetical protein
MCHVSPSKLFFCYFDIIYTDIFKNKVLLATNNSVSKRMETIILKILPDTAPFPKMDGEKILNTKASIKKIKLIDSGLLPHF